MVRILQTIFTVVSSHSSSCVLGRAPKTWCREQPWRLSVLMARALFSWHVVAGRGSGSRCAGDISPCSRQMYILWVLKARSDPVILSPVVGGGSGGGLGSGGELSRY